MAASRDIIAPLEGLRMLYRTSLVAMALAVVALAGPAAAETPAVPAEPTLGSFVISPTNPPRLPDPSAFDLGGDPLLIGRDRADRMTMPVEIGGGRYDFVIDTGSQRTIVAKQLAQRLALPQLSPVEIVSMAGRVTVDTVTLGGLRFGDHLVENLHALSIDHKDLGGAGLIGLDSLRDKRLTLDFKLRRMDVGKSRRTPTHGDPDTIVVQARSRLGQLILVSSRIDGRRVNVILDTGAEISIGNMALFDSLKLKRLVIPPQPTTLTSVTGIEVPAQYTVVKKITIGSVTLENVPMVFLDAAPFEELGLGDRPAMLLGMHMLRLFDRVAIDFGNRHVDFHLRKGAALPDLGRLASAGAADATMR